MEQEIYLDFIPYEIYDGDGTEEQIWLINRGMEWLVVKKSEWPDAQAYAERILYLGKYHNMPCFAAGLKAGLEPPATLPWSNLRDEAWLKRPKLYQVATKADHLRRWDMRSRFCGCCGAVMEMEQTHRAKRCTQCGYVEFPRISPAIIVAVTRGDKLLLAHNRSFKNNWYSVIAGFVEQGETLEDCVKREVLEEVGIHVKNIRYYKSQPWFGNDSLMLGFFAQYESGEIHVDGEEIDAADWFPADGLPNMPSRISIANALIQAFLDGMR